MLRPLILGTAAGLTFMSTLTMDAAAQSVDMRWEVLAPDEQELIDLLAADFYEDNLRLSQASAIEAHTSELYAEASPADRARFRAERRTHWEEMTDKERRKLADAARPSYGNLTEDQKAPFRSIALDQVEAAGAINEDALAEALRNEI